MRAKSLFVFLLVVLAVAGCASPKFNTPTPEGYIGETATPVPQPSVVAATTPGVDGTAVPVGGVEVALALVQPVDGALAKVNGAEIKWADFEPELIRALHSVTQQYGVDWNQAENQALLPQFEDQVLQNVADRVLLRQLTDEEGYKVDKATLETRIQEEKDAILASGQYTSWEQFLEQAGMSDEHFARLVEDAELIDQVAKAKSPTTQAEQVHARHILVETEETGQEVLSRLAAGEDFAALAAEYSTDPGSKDSGGDLGWFPKGTMVAEFEEAAFSLEPGTTSDLVKTDYGYHIIQVLEKEMRDLDEQSLDTQRQQAFADWLTEKKATAQIEIITKFATE